MANASAPLTPIQLLAVQWRVLGMLAVAIGRRISLATKMRSRAGVAEAEMLEAWLYAAIVTLSRQIAAHTDQGAELSPEDAEALNYLKTVYTHLSILALLTAQMRRDLEAVTAERCADTPRLLAAPLPAAPDRDLGFLDSS